MLVEKTSVEPIWLYSEQRDKVSPFPAHMLPFGDTVYLILILKLSQAVD